MIQKKNDINLFYNSTKSGVDSVDQRCANYLTSRRTRRWLMTLFYAILNKAGINSRIIYQFAKDGEELPRDLFLKDLGKDLYSPHIKLRIYNNNVPRQIRNLVAEILSIKIVSHLEPPQNEVQKKGKRCGVCPPKKDRKTNYACSACKIPIYLNVQFRFVQIANRNY